MAFKVQTLSALTLRGSGTVEPKINANCHTFDLTIECKIAIGVAIYSLTRRVDQLLSYAGSGLPQGPFLGNNSFHKKMGLRWVCFQWAEMGPKVGQRWIFGAKVGQNASKPTFAPTLNPFRHIHENPLFAQFKGGGNCFPKRALRQSRPSRTIEQLCVRNLAWHFSVFSYEGCVQNPARQKLTNSWTWIANCSHEHFHVEIAGVFLAEVLWQHPRYV